MSLGKVTAAKDCCAGGQLAMHLTASRTQTILLTPGYLPPVCHTMTQ